MSMRATPWVLLLLVTAYNIYAGARLYQRDKEAGQILAARDYNVRSYKCATVYEYGNGRVTFNYYVKKEGC